MNVPVISAPALDAAEPIPTPSGAAVASFAPQDWEQLVSPGHVLRARLLHRSGRRYALACVGLVAAIAVAFVGPRSLAYTLPNTWALSMMPTLFEAVDFGGDKLAITSKFMADIPPQAGMNGGQWNALVAAVVSDIRSSGYDPRGWETVAALDPAPRITRPAKSFETEALPRLSTGVVAVAENPTRNSAPVDLFGFVDGRFSWISYAAPDTTGRFGCYVMTGPDVPDCTRESQDTRAPGKGDFHRAEKFATPEIRDAYWFPSKYDDQGQYVPVASQKGEE